MRLGTIAFLLGCLATQQLAILPGIRWSVGLLLLFISLVIAVKKLSFTSNVIPVFQFLLLIACGTSWASIHAGAQLAHSLPDAYEGADLLLEGDVVSLPIKSNLRYRFDFRTKIENKSYLLRLNRYTRGKKQFQLLPKAGERWRLRIKLKKPNGYANPGGFDYERSLFRQGINASGYVRSGEVNERLETASQNAQASPVLLIRSQLARQIKAVINRQPHHGLIRALSLGDRRDISAEEWQVLSRTGTNHLIAISGLHIGLVAGLIFFCVRFLLGFIPKLVSQFPAQVPAAYVAMSGALFYALLAGFTIPTQRALIMIVIVMLGVVLRRKFVPSNILALALLLVVIYDPLSVLDIGFWLSFSAVAIIAYAVSGRIKSSNKLWQWSQVQIVIALGMLPLMLLLFQRVSIIAPIANSLAVPWISFITVPLSLSGSALVELFPLAGEFLLFAAVKSMQALWWLLEWLSQLSFAVWQGHVPQTWTLIPAIIGALWLLLPRGMPARWLGIIWILPMFLLPRQGPEAGQLSVTLLDVGQGLAVLVRTQNHVLLYDAGPSYSANFDTGRVVILPYLSEFGISKIDRMIISHGDNDHRGGANSVLAGTDVDKIMTGAMPVRWTHANAESCLQGQRWQWDGVEFLVLNPQTKTVKKRNNRSCVLQIRLGDQSVLLTGDIEKAVERQLTKRYGQQLQSNVLIAPHHGSKTSSSLKFLQVVQPEVALIANGYRNRYRFPHQQVVSRYQQLGIGIHETAREGALSVFIQDGQPIEVQSWRHSHQRYWHRTEAVQ